MWGAGDLRHAARRHHEGGAEEARAVVAREVAPAPGVCVSECECVKEDLVCV